MQPLIHIGYHKTGTTWLQHNIFNKPEKGYWAGWTVQNGRAIHQIVLPSRYRFSHEEVRRCFLDDYDRANKEDLVPVISHEDLCGYPVYSRYYGAEVADRLHAAFPDARIIIGIREQRSAIMSLYAQYIRQDGEWPMSVFIGTGNETEGFSPICRLEHLEYDLLIEHYMRTFGAKNVLVLPLEKLREQPLDYEQSVHTFAGSLATPTEVLPPALTGRGGLAQVLERKLNRHWKRSPLWCGDHNSLPLTYRSAKKLVRIVDKVLPKALQKAALNSLRAFVDERVGHYYRSSNKRLCELIDTDLAQYGYDVD